MASRIAFTSTSPGLLLFRRCRLSFLAFALLILASPGFGCRIGRSFLGSAPPAGWSHRSLAYQSVVNRRSRRKTPGSRNSWIATTKTTTTTTAKRLSMTERDVTAEGLRMTGAVGNSVRVMVNGMPGPMATAAAEACLRKGLELAPTAMTGPDMPRQVVEVTDPVTGRSSPVELIPATDANRDEIAARVASMRQEMASTVTDAPLAAAASTEPPPLLVIDFTHPSAVNENARFYVEQRLPFVMGTTGGDRDQLHRDVREGRLPCVISPNMGKQIVAMQSALEDMASKYPGAFAGYKLSVTESHQVSKADTSGTALAVIGSINRLLSPADRFSPTDVQLIRDESKALEFGVPSPALKGHAFHTYRLTSPDGSVTFELQHNVAGRTIYAEGTADAIKFLAKKIREGASAGTAVEEAQVYTMANVLEEGALE